jgi:hypothetical protein
MRNQQNREKIYIRFLNGRKIIKSYQISQLRRDLLELIREQVYGSDDKKKQL